MHLSKWPMLGLYRVLLVPKFLELMSMGVRLRVKTPFSSLHLNNLGWCMEFVW